MASSIWGPFLESPETFRAHFGWHNSLCIFKTKASESTKLCSCFNFYSLYSIWKDQLYGISGSEFYEWLFGPEKFSGLSRNGPQASYVVRLFDSHFSLVYFSGVKYILARQILHFVRKMRRNARQSDYNWRYFFLSRIWLLWSARWITSRIHYSAILSARCWKNLYS